MPSIVLSSSLPIQSDTSAFFKLIRRHFLRKYATYALIAFFLTALCLPILHPSILHPYNFLIYRFSSSGFLFPFHTSRIGCREMQSGAQSCVFEGLSCINLSLHLPTNPPNVYLLSNLHADFQPLKHDSWCKLRHVSSDPRYYGPRSWPIDNSTIAPRQSCMLAWYRTKKSLFENIQRNRIKMLDSLWLVNLDYVSNPHNNHLIKDIVWLLDVKLFQSSLSLQPFDDKSSMQPFRLFSDPPVIYPPQSRQNFSSQTSKDINRLTYSIILQQNLESLYPNLTTSQLHTAPDVPRVTAPLFEAFPSLEQPLVFHEDLRQNPDIDLVCAPKLVVGAKIGNGAHERVCREMRTKGYQLYGIPPLKTETAGYLKYPRPPRRVVILQRHITRGIQNLDSLVNGLKHGLDNVEIEVVSTEKLDTAEGFVRVFSKVGVLITPHGSQSMGMIWMPRHR